MVRISEVNRGSFADRAGILPDDVLVAINSNPITDVLDYMFYVAESKVVLTLERDKKSFNKTIIKSEYDDIGLEFDTFLMDCKKSCTNNCVFCFIDQMPSGMRESLYFKDDDARLSFLQGNYITLTNLNQSDIDRIIKMKLNMNVSVHTTNPELRCRMMNNRFAGEKIDYLWQLSRAGIMMNCQIVLCPQLNDGDELDRTLSDLSSMMPNIQSIAVVPLGMTKFREGLQPLTPVDKQCARRTIEIINSYNEKLLEEYGARVIFPADEFFLKAEMEIPSAEYYEDYPQYENGVGMLRSLEDEFEDALEDAEYDGGERRISFVTGVAAYPLISKFADKVMNKWHNIKCDVYPIKNNFFGESITVSGLVTGKDILAQLEGINMGDLMLIPSSMLRRDSEVFLDDLTVTDLSISLNVKIKSVENDGYSLLDTILGRE